MSAAASAAMTTRAFPARAVPARAFMRPRAPLPLGLPGRRRASDGAAAPRAPPTPTTNAAVPLASVAETTTTTTTTAGPLAPVAETTTTTTTATDAPPSRPFYLGKRAVVVGAGPAGSAAAMFLAQQGFSVDVYDRRPEPRADLIDGGRAYVIIAIPRGRKVLDELGVRIGPEAEEALVAGGAAAAATAPAAAASDEGEPRPPPPRAGTVRHAADGKVTSSREDGNVQLSRSALAQALIDAARARYGRKQGGDSSSSSSGAAAAAAGSVAFHFNWSAEGGVDLRRRRVTFTRTGDGDVGSGKEGGSDWAVAPYDLLVGADGAASVVRAAFSAADAEERQQAKETSSAPPFTVTIEDTGREYKVYSGAPGGDAFSEPEGLEGAATLHLWRPKKPTKARRWDRFASFTAHSNPDKTYSGTMALRKGMHAALKTAEDYEALLRDAFSGVPEAWVPSVAEQLARNKERSAGRRVRCSRLEGGAGGRACLVGDAAHGVSPVFGQGMNSALESCSVLARVLRECAQEAEARAEALNGDGSNNSNGDNSNSNSNNTAVVDAALDAAPRRFDAERREDVHALVALDRKAFSFFGAGPLWDAFQLLAHIVVGSVLGRLAPWLYGRARPALLSLGSPEVRYGAILRDVRRDAAGAAAVLGALAVWVGARLWAAKGEALRKAVAGVLGGGA